jgi:hypothetical protein
MELIGAEWRKSSHSSLPGVVAVRDSKDPDGPELIVSPAEWRAFVAGARDGEFDLG